MRKEQYFENGWLKEEYLWPLRKEIELGSNELAHYVNSFGIEADNVANFFDGFLSGYAEERREDGVTDIDNEQELLRYYRCFKKPPLPPNYINVDIFVRLGRSIRVVAGHEVEAEEIVNEMMSNKEILLDTFEPCEDWELDTSWQPED